MKRHFGEGIATVGDVGVGREITCVSSACRLPTAALPLHHFHFLRQTRLHQPSAPPVFSSLDLGHGLLVPPGVPLLSEWDLGLCLKLTGLASPIYFYLRNQCNKEKASGIFLMPRNPAAVYTGGVHSVSLREVSPGSSSQGWWTRLTSDDKQFTTSSEDTDSRQQQHSNM